MTVEQLTEEERGSWLRGLTGWSLARDGKAIIPSGRMSTTAWRSP